MLLALAPPVPMQGCLARAAPARLTTSLCASVSRRFSGSGIAFCCDSFAPASSANSDSSSGASSNPNPSPTPYSFRQSDGDSSEGSVRRRTLAPLPSSSGRERFWSDFDDRPGARPRERFRSEGSSSEPSRPSIPGKFSKYSKPISRAHAAGKAERRDKKAFRKPMGDVAAAPDRNLADRDETSRSGMGMGSAPAEAQKDGNWTPDYLPEWMSNYQFTYSETPSAPIVGFRQTPWSPFGPEDMLARPWTGRAPLQPSKKKRPEFDSFNPPPAGKKGVKYVQKPGPFPPGEGPRRGKTREEILGAPLTTLEIQELVTAVNKGNKQLNLGRDGLTHNMLDVIHSHWKRSVVCKIKCKGVPTVDMENVARVIEEKTGGVIILRQGGVIFLFRGRNYNYRDRPHIPIMLWKPPDPIYPRLIQTIPEGLTEEEAKSLRGKGRRVAPMCRLSKNGVYLNLVADVRAQFEIDDVVKVDCQGMHATDYKKIGAKLKELVPCTLLSFEKEQIIMCRKRTTVHAKDEGVVEDPQASSEAVDQTSRVSSSSLQEQTVVGADHILEASRVEDGESGVGRDLDLVHLNNENLEEEYDLETASFTWREGDEGSDRDSDLRTETTEDPFENAASIVESDLERVSVSESSSVAQEESMPTTVRNDETAPFGANALRQDFDDTAPDLVDGAMSFLDSENEEQVVADRLGEGTSVNIDDLWQSAIDEGNAIELDSQNADADEVMKKAAQQSGLTDAEARAEADRIEEEKRAAAEVKSKSQIPPKSPFDVPPRRGLELDELAKLLAP